VSLPLFDIPLNSTVPIEDAVRLKQQTREILELFLSAHERGGRISTIDLTHAAGQYNARLYEVRRFLVHRSGRAGRRRSQLLSDGAPRAEHVLSEAQGEALAVGYGGGVMTGGGQSKGLRVMPQSLAAEDDLMHGG